MRGRVALALVGTLIGVILLGACADDTEPTLDSVEVTDLPEIPYGERIRPAPRRP
jgi:hypothetical protein